MTRRLAWTASIAMVTVLLVAAALPATANAEELWFPVELPLDSYADTWGAPRGGGRSHEGTDILAPQMRRVYAAASDKPIRIGITSDASGQYANSGASDRRGMLMAIAEANEKGGVLGRKIEHQHIDTETTAATGSRVAERLITREDCGFLVGAV